MAIVKRRKVSSQFLLLASQQVLVSEMVSQGGYQGLQEIPA